MFLRPQSDFSSKADYEPQKTRVCTTDLKEIIRHPEVTPESEGVSSLYIRDFLNDLQKLSCDLHHFLMLRHGKVIAEASFSPYLKETWHSQHGIAKSITNLAVGMLVDEGKLSPGTKLTEIFGSRISFLNSLKLKNISVYDLLTMSSGSTFNESGIHSGNDWLSMFFDAPLHFEPGCRFEYDSMNSYVLSAAVTALKGIPMDDYLKPRLFEPLGIRNYIWEKCPRGITKGGWGLTMYPEDVAKIGQLYMKKGVYGDKRIISDAWMEKSLEKRFEFEDSPGYGYGCQVIVGAKPGDIMFSGMMLQECFVFSQNDIVIVINAGGDDNKEESLNDLVSSYFGDVYNPPAFLVDNPSSKKKLDDLLSSFSKRAVKVTRKRGGWKKKSSQYPADLSFEKMSACIHGLSYVLDTKGCSFMPHFLQYMQNNRTSGLSEISFEKDKKGLVIHMKEEDRTNDLLVAHDKDRYSVMSFKGEQYIVSGIAQFAKDEDNDLCLKAEASFIEGECRRYVRIFFKNDFENIKIEFTETPASDMFLPRPQTGGMTDAADILTGSRKDLYEKIGENILWARP